MNAVLHHTIFCGINSKMSELSVFVVAINYINTLDGLYIPFASVIQIDVLKQASQKELIHLT